MDAPVDAEVAKYREMMKNGGTLPAMAPVALAPQGRKSRKPDSIGRFKIMNEFVDFSARLLDTTAQAAWLVLFRETKPNGIACVSHSQIAERIGASRRTVVRAVQHLKDAKLVTVVHRGGLKGGTSSYRIHGAPQGCDASVTPTSVTRVTGGVTKRVISA